MVTKSGAPSDEGTCPKQDPRLGDLLYSFERTSRVTKARRRSIEVLGIAGVILVPVSVLYVPGWVGTVVAVLAGCVAVASYFLSGGKRTRPREVVCIYRNGLSRTKGTETERVVWNQVVEIDCHDLRPQPDQVLTTVVVELAARPPWFIVLGGTFSTNEQKERFTETLASEWLPVWSRRQRVLVELRGSMSLGSVEVSAQGLSVSGREISWDQIKGTSDRGGIEALVTSEQTLSLDDPAAPRPFPSTARRVAALASAPPTPPLLPVRRS